MNTIHFCGDVCVKAYGCLPHDEVVCWEDMVDNVTTCSRESDSGSDSKYSSGDDEKEEQVAENKEIDRRRDVMAGVCQVFESQVLAVHHKISASEKRRIVIDLVGHPLETFFSSGALLIRGKDLYKRLAAMAKQKAFKTIPIKKMSEVVIKVGLLIHQEQCDDENGLDCPV